MSSEARCPVCGRTGGPDEPGATCGQCGWPWYVPLRAGAVTADMWRDFAARLQAARRDQAKREARTLDAELRGVIADLYPGAMSTVIDIGADQVSVTTAYLDAAGSPQLRDGGSVAWTDVLPMLSGTEHARHRQLADGGDGLGDDAVARLLRDRMPPVPDGRVLVICRVASWRVLEAAATALAGRPRARLLRLFAARGASAREQLADLAASAPLRHPYQLMTAMVDRRTGAVALRPRQLFAVGAEPGTEASLTLRRMPGDAADTTLAIFADTSGNSRGADGVAADPVALYSVPLPAGPAALVRAVLDGPGRVRIVEPTGAVPYPGTWAQVCRQIPGRVSTAAAPVDLVCAIDLAGTPNAVRQRVGLICDLVRLLDTEYREEGRLQVGIVTCTDHIFGRGPGKNERAPVTRVSPLGPAGDALAWLGKTTGADISYPPAAPVEDLLHESLTLLAGSRRADRIPLLVTVAGRRPHPHAQLPDDRLPCPRKFMWQDLIARLTREAGARCMVVADALPADGAETAEWRQLGRAGQRVLSGATGRQIAEDLGLLTAQEQRIPLPLTDEPEGAIR
jgi:hypothetical protein